MAENLFEKYGIKEVADVTFYRIERKNETYESQRTILASTIIKGVVELKTVYPIGEDGVSSDEGFEAYVFTGAEIIKDDTDHGHQYSYEKQALMEFAKSQNLINKAGVRYDFKSEEMFGSLIFDDNFSLLPKSTEKAAVLGLDGYFTAETYDVSEIDSTIKALTFTIKAKAYDAVYKDYAELIVEDEMGYFLTKHVTKDLDCTETYSGTDELIKNATTWTAGECKSINDAILALRAKKKTLDQSSESSVTGVTKVSGGYEVTDAFDLSENDDSFEYTLASGLSSTKTSKYALSAVLQALTELSGEVTFEAEDSSNRAIYVNIDEASEVAASSAIYLLKNVNAKKLSSDTTGVFTFRTKTGETAYYNDAIFAGKEYLALVIIGTKGLIFVVDRNGSRKFEKVAWMVNETGYLTDSQATKVVKNGIIHTIDVDINNETFEATCTLDALKVRKTQKAVLRYVPVLFLDTLKVSTLEQTAEQTSANGGKGNSPLIIWDYGKEITLSLEDALYCPASMAAMLGSYEGNDFTKGVKDTKMIDRTEKCTAKRSFIVPAGNSKGVPSEGENTAQAVYIDLATMQPYQDGAPIAEGETYLKWTRSVAYGDNSIGNTIEISADKFPGTYKVVGDTYSRNKTTGEDQRFQFVIPQAKMSTSQTITLEAEGDPTVFSMELRVLRPDDGVMVKLIQYDVVENVEENDGSTMVKNTENLNLLEDAEMFKVSDVVEDTDIAIGATEY